ncbi:hypothetical protein [Leifsonia sp. EB34]|uniref:hypothetical protein n=1 Tax=Leifsonia sp. EB34 TaxID=3156303 RepID=UPI0035119D4E
MLAIIQTELENAYMKHEKGSLSDSGFAAVVNTAPTSLKALNLLATGGMQSEVGSLLEDTTLTPPAVAGATFDPRSQPFRADMMQAISVCQQNGTPMGVLEDG